MHGIVHKGLKDHVDEDVDGVGWDEVAASAGIEPKLYLPVSHYPDEEVTAALAIISERTDATEQSVQREFGRYLAPPLLDTFKAHIRDDWGTQETILALETIYEQLATLDDSAASASVSTRAVGEDVVVTYRSERELCALLTGVVFGIAAHHDDTIAVSKRACLREGDDHCELLVRSE